MYMIRIHTNNSTYLKTNNSFASTLLVFPRTRSQEIKPGALLLDETKLIKEMTLRELIIPVNLNAVH